MKYDNGALAQTERGHLGHEPADALVLAREEGRVEPAGERQMFEMLQPAGLALIGIVWRVDRVIDEERLRPVFFGECGGLVEHEVGEVAAVFKNLGAVALQVVDVGAAPVEKVRVVVDASAEVAETVIEALSVGTSRGGRAEMPLANLGGGIAGVLEQLGERHLRRPQTHAGAGVVEQAGAAGIAAGQKRRARGRTDSGGGVELRKAHPGLRQRVHVRRMQIGGAIAAEVYAALIVGHDDDYVGTRRGGPENRSGEQARSERGGGNGESVYG